MAVDIFKKQFAVLLSTTLVVATFNEILYLT
jgi:hypothetical protein